MENIKTENIAISHQGRKISGTVYLPQMPQNKKCPIVIFNHGFNGSGDNFINHAKLLAQNGIGAVTYDFCGGALHSRSDLQTREMTIFTEKEDLCAVLETVKSWDYTDNDNIFLFGASMGGLVAALTADERIDEIRGMILLYPALCVADDWNRHFTEIENIPEIHEVWGVPLGREFFETLHGFNVFEHIGKYSENVLILHGDKDNIVPLAYSQKADEIYGNSRLEIFHGEGHGFSAVGEEQVARSMADFLKKAIH